MREVVMQTAEPDSAREPTEKMVKILEQYLCEGRP